MHLGFGAPEAVERLRLPLPSHSGRSRESVQGPLRDAEQLPSSPSNSKLGFCINLGVRLIR